MKSPQKSPKSCNRNIRYFPAYAYFLWTLSFFFLMRVIGQLIQELNSVSWLPQLDAWQGSSLPYWILLSVQLLILVVMARTSHRHASGCVVKNPTKGKWLLALGGVYFLSMTARLVVGIANLSTNPWFQKLIPAFFHIVLATYILLIAAFHMNWLAKSNEFDLNEDFQ